MTKKSKQVLQKRPSVANLGVEMLKLVRKHYGVKTKSVEEKSDLSAIRFTGLRGRTSLFRGAKGTRG